MTNPPIPNHAPPAEKPTNYREMRRRTERNLIVGGFVIMFVIGGGLIALLWGVEAMLQGWLCMGGAALLLFVFVIVFRMLDIISKSGDE
jgi:fucose permease